uniref:GRIP domain-containing protein n=1 Tax=Globodera pallida TaxID=36090 RepID=A0A183BYM5_GLOPA
MESFTNTEAALSLFDTTGQSTFALAEKEHQIDRLKRQVRVLESENTELISSQPRLRNAMGKDCTGEMVKLNNELLLAKEQCERWRNDFGEMSKKYEKFEKATIEQLDKRDKEIQQLRHQALEIEEENEKLREMFQDEKSRVWRMHQEEFGSPLATPKAQIFADILSTGQSVEVPENAAEVSDELMRDFDVNDADQIATHLLMILETLDKNQHDSTNIQNEIFAFLTAQGISSNNPEKFAAFSSIYKKVIDKRLAEIRAGNELLRSDLTLGDKDLEACMKHLMVQDSITLSSMPSFAGLSKEIALQLEATIFIF